MAETVYKGPSYPFRLSSTGGFFISDSGPPNFTKIVEGIRLILDTRIGEVPMNREFGSRVHIVNFEPNDEQSKLLLEYYIREAIDKFEDRVTAKDINFRDTTINNIQTMIAQINFVVKKFKVSGNMEYTILI